MSEARILETLVDRFDQLDESLDSKFDKIDQRFDQVENKLEEHDQRFDKLVNILKEQNIELNYIKKKLMEHSYQLDEINYKVEIVHEKIFRLCLDQNELDMKIDKLKNSNGGNSEKSKKNINSMQ